ncbi:MAG TPA: hypothetical protein VGR28_01215 [Candidatus Thermoplasmatota archaeon]|jgi:hypothetical protein|nr:hypothetical protein [Candidatus Thermoplasmatota archaeon]
MRRGWIALLGSLAVLSPAAAQAPDTAAVPTSLSVVIAPPDGPIQPLGPFAALPLQVAYTFHEVVPLISEATEITLELTSSPAGVVATLSPTTLYVQPSSTPCGCERTLVADALLLVSTSTEAPGLRPDTITVTARAGENRVYAASEAQGEVEVEAGFFSQLDASMTTTIFKLGPFEAAEATMLIVNLGNAPTKVSFGADLRLGIGVVPPGPIVLGSRQVGDASNEASGTWRLLAPEQFSAGAGNLTLRGALASDPKIPGDEANVTIRVDPRPAARPTSNNVPDFGALGALAAVPGALLAGRRRA